MPNFEEKRQLTFRGVELETREEGSCRYVDGAIPYNVYSEDLGGWREFISPGAFSKSVKEGDIRCLWNHESRYVCGRNVNETLTFSDDDTALRFSVKMPDTTWARDLLSTISRGDATGVSFGFYVIKDSWTEDREKDELIRELKEVRLVEVSIGVTFPAYPDAACNSSTRELGMKNGVDFAEIGRIMAMRERRDYQLNESERKSVRGLINYLAGLLPEDTAEKRQDNPPEIEPGKDPTQAEGEERDEKPGKDPTLSAREREIAIAELGL